MMKGACLALEWVATPLAVVSYGAWGRAPSNFLAQVTARLAIRKSLSKTVRHLLDCSQT